MKINLKCIKRSIRFLIEYIGYPKEKLVIQRSGNKPAIFLMGSPEYNNLGDHAIAYATKVFITENFSDVDFFEIRESDIKYNFRHVRKVVRDDDVLLLQGGGNMGDVYPDQVAIRKKVLTTFMKNLTVVLPQTIYFTNTSAQLPSYFHKRKNNCVLIARENKSYEIMSGLFSGKVLLTPDIVFYLSGRLKSQESNRKGIILCLRDDIEKSSLISKNNIMAIFENLGKSITEYSTVKSSNISIEEREWWLNNLIADFSSAEIVVTDRLHGMIISALTETPCIVFPTYNHKLTYCYEWVDTLNYICLCKDESELSDCIDKLLNLKDKSHLFLNDSFQEIVKIIKNGLESRRIL